MTQLRYTDFHRITTQKDTELISLSTINFMNLEYDMRAEVTSLVEVLSDGHR
jgi:hypothetical protein